MRPAPFSAASCWFSFKPINSAPPELWDATRYMVPGVVFKSRHFLLTSAFWSLKSYSGIFVLKKHVETMLGVSKSMIFGE